MKKYNIHSEDSKEPGLSEIEQERENQTESRELKENRIFCIIMTTRLLVIHQKIVKNSQKGTNKENAAYM